MPVRVIILLALLFQTVFVLAEDDAQSQYVLVDFEDVGTWRAVNSSGTVPGTWFAADQYLSGRRYVYGCNDKSAGEIRYAFAEGSRPKYIVFQRTKMSQLSAFINALEFRANPAGLNSNVSFDLLDSSGAIYHTKPVSLSGTEWKTYHLDINENTVSKFASMRPPLRLKRIIFGTGRKEACSGSAWLDDITILGAIPGAKTISMTPIYEDIAWKPEEPVKSLYRLRNANATPQQVKLTATVTDINATTVAQKEQTISVPARGQVLAPFDFGILQTGAYAVQIEYSFGKYKNQQLDWIGVFTPNGKRVNHSGMLFGICDQTMWQGDGENQLHYDWMRRIGFDIDRVGTTGSRLEPQKGVSGLNGLGKMLRDHSAYGLDACLLYLGVTTWMQNKPHGSRLADNDTLFSDHIHNIGSYLSLFPNLKYVEFWNEPDIGFLVGTREEYVKAMGIFSREIRKTAPDIKIATGSFTGLDHPRHKKDFEKFFAEADDDYDIATFHSHGSFDRYQLEQGWIENILAKDGIQKKICNTETGERAGYDAPGGWGQATTLVKKITFARHRDTEFYLWFTLQDYWDMDDQADDSFGLITSDNRPKPSLVAYNELIRQLANTSALPLQDLADGVTGYRFRTADDTQDIHVLWSTQSGKPEVVAIEPTAPVLVYDMFGKKLQQSDGSGLMFIPVGDAPVYLRSDKGELKKADMSFIDYPAQVPAVTGEPTGIPLTLRNIWSAPAVFTVSSPDADSAEPAISIAPGAQKQIVLTLPAQTATHYGSQAKLVQLSVKGLKNVSLQLPVSMPLSYPLERKTLDDYQNTATPIPQDLPSITLDTLESVHEITHDPQIRQWSGPQDLGLRTAAVHDEKDMLFLFDVTDDKHSQDEKGSSIWRGDSVQLAIQTGNANPLEVTIALTVQGPRAWCYTAPDQALVGECHFPVTAERSGTLTKYRIRIPFTAFGGATIPAGTPIRFSILINENDGQGRVRWLHWFDGIGKSKNPAEYGYGVIR